VIKVLVLGAGPAGLDNDDYPIWLTEHAGELLVERVARSCGTIGPSELIFAVRERDVRRHHINNIIELAVPGARIVQVRGSTAGAACTALLAIAHIGADDELLILNANEFINEDYGAILRGFRERELDGGVAVFPSLHPRYSYVRLDENELVIEAAEKKPISREATVGFYWYRRGGDFLRATQNMIRKDAQVDRVFYICPAFNEMVLDHARIGIHRLPAGHYHPVKSARQLERYTDMHLPESDPGADLPMPWNRP
jgi:hypothetical protein